MKIAVTSVLGGPDTGEIRGCLQQIKDELRELGAKVEVEGVELLEIRLGVSGNISRMTEEGGFNRLTVYASRRKAQADVTVHGEVWRLGAGEFRRYFLSAVEAALLKLQRRLKSPEANSGVDRLLAGVRTLGSGGR